MRISGNVYVILLTVDTRLNKLHPNMPVLILDVFNMIIIIIINIIWPTSRAKNDIREHIIICNITFVIHLRMFCGRKTTTVKILKTYSTFANSTSINADVS